MDLTKATDITIGGKSVSQLYLGGRLVWERWRESDTWESMDWIGLTTYSGAYVWTDGTNIYYSKGSSGQYVLDKSTKTWGYKTWNGTIDGDTPVRWALGSLGNEIWSDGTDIYASSVYELTSGGVSYTIPYTIRLNKSNSTWSAVSLIGFPSNKDFRGGNIWNVGNDVYYSEGDTQYTFNRSTLTWSVKTWSIGLPFYKSTDLCNINNKVYMLYSGKWYEYDATVKQFHETTFSYGSGVSVYNFVAYNIWTDGRRVYHSNANKHHYLDDKTWKVKTWNGMTSFNGSLIWRDGNDVYYSNGTTQKKLKK